MRRYVFPTPPGAGIAAVIDRLLGPVVAAASVARRSRLFHPCGIVVRATATAAGESLPARALAVRLAGPVLIRFSGSWWKRREWKDVLGVALRFTSAPIDEYAKVGDQDLLMITASSLWTLPVAALATQQHDYLANAYHGAAWFALDGIGRAELRLVPRAVPAETLEGADRGERLLDAVRRGGVVLELQLRRQWRHTWCPLVEIRLTEAVDLDQDRLRFWPFHDGRGIHPSSWVHMLRRRSYRWGQASRQLVRWPARTRSERSTRPA